MFATKQLLLINFWVSSILIGKYVFLKDDIISLIYKNKLSKETKKQLTSEFKTLKENGYSVVVFPEKNISIFGKCETLPIEITEFLFETGFDLKYLFLIGTYYASPIWSKEHRKCETRYFQQFEIEHNIIKNHTPEKRHQEISNFMPSSASVYAHKFPLHIRSNKLAENIDTIVYACPNCRSFFSIYSEFNCIKCRECGTVIEFSKDGKILFSKQITLFDDIEEFLFDTLIHKDFDNNPLIEYENVTRIALNNKNRIEKKPETELKIYANKFSIKNETFNKTYDISDVEEFNLLPKNTLEVVLKKGKPFHIQGKNKENLYILIDLLKLYRK